VEVVRPGGTDEVRRCVAAAERAGRVIVASGLGVHLDVGGAPARVGVLLRLDRLGRVIDVQPGDMTVTVEAGCPLPMLQATLAAAGQWLPLDPPAAERTTIGGLLAANLSGPLRASQGTARDLLLGLSVVGADGALVSGGGRVVKNVAGYDVPKLHVGALGTLGVLVEATFKVRPRPPREAALAIACDAPGDAAAVAAALLDAPVPPYWLEVEAPGHAGGVTVFAGFAGVEEEVSSALGHAGRRAGGRAARPVADPAAERARLADVRGAAATLRIAALPRDVGAMLDAVAASGGASRAVAHAANGVVRVAVADVDAVPALVRALRPAAERRGGSLVVERAAAAVKAHGDPWGEVPDGLALMRGVKAALDPAGVFARGRFVGGI
jgi:glycolate oxidase FAD binding subunit